MRLLKADDQSLTQLVSLAEITQGVPVIGAAHQSPVSQPATAVGSAPTAVTVLAAVRSLMRVGSREEVVGVLIDAVRDLGGTVIPVHQRAHGTLDVDISFGIGEPLLASSSDPVTQALLAHEVGLLIDDARLAIERIDRAPDMAADSDTDPLTGLGNWSFATRVLSRMNVGDAVAVVDIENLKYVNDHHGPATGDQVLLSFARTLRRCARAADTVGRVGGTQFVWLFRGTTPTGAESAIGRLRGIWESERPLHVTFAAGLAVIGGAGPTEAYMYADGAVQSAQRMGANQTVISA